MAQSNNITVYTVHNYKITDKQIEKDGKQFTVQQLSDILPIKDYSYHLRIHNNTNYVFFGDLDNMTCDFYEWANDFIVFLKNTYNIDVIIDDIHYTVNKSKKGSYHYSIPKYYASCETLWTIHTRFNKIHTKYIFVGEKGINKKCIDTTIYSEHWFRLPYQSKKGVKAYHQVVHGDLIDFIVPYIPTGSINIDKFVANVQPFNYKPKKITKNNSDINKNNKDKLNKSQNLQGIETNLNNYTINTNTINFDIDEIYGKDIYFDQYTIYKRFFDECYTDIRFTDYDYWSSVGMALKNIYGLSSFELFDYFSSKGNNYDGVDKTYEKFQSFGEDFEHYKGTGTLYHYAIEDNLEAFKKIVYGDKFIFSETHVAKKIRELAGDCFVYIKNGYTYQLYCYNGTYWEQDSVLLRKFISDTVYNHYFKQINILYKTHKDYNKYIRIISNLNKLSFKNSVIETYKEFGTRNIHFDSKWWLLGFNNMVYDLQTSSFRKYKKNDYVSITTGYDWRYPTSLELDTINNIIASIMPDDKVRLLYKHILCTSLEGRPLEKFIIFNAPGRNGKGLIDDMLIKALGSYAFCANNSILFETSKTGSNPEKANMHKKRLVIFKEPPSKKKFENSVIKELSGGGSFSARTHNEKETEKTLHCTIICECNKKPDFAEEPTNAEVGRLIDIYFPSTFTENVQDVDHDNNIFLANIQFKDFDFQQDHKFALLQILFDAYIGYKASGFVFNIPDSIKNRTFQYLEKSCHILSWFKEHFHFVEKCHNNVFVSIKNVFNLFKSSDFFHNLSKFEKRKFTLPYFIDYFQHNILTKKFFKIRHQFYDDKNDRCFTSNILLHWNVTELDDSDTDDNNNHGTNNNINNNNPLDNNINNNPLDNNINNNNPLDNNINNNNNYQNKSPICSNSNKLNYNFDINF